ncbi:hypothetical protein PAT3040_01715 [Paenibacillus agaridevorans]|uniref:Alpha-L-rhamnosidase n=1 Tax=Paenibacillus agaridevorans TaxID=171404 RepID=A0A2R5EKU4_9BACL|nr:hypothetical protein PAT3040_01715 [Paenibacillus agaridevorans]
MKTHYYETVEAGKYLRPGDNVIAVKVLHYAYGSPRPEGVFFSPLGALILEGEVRSSEGELLESIVTDDQWEVMRDDAITFLSEDITCVGGPESVDGRLLPHGWEYSDYKATNQHKWEKTFIVKETESPYDGFMTPWQLTPRSIPLLFERLRPFKREMRREGDFLIEKGFPEKGSLCVEPRTEMAIELDAGELTTGNIRFVIEGGKGATIRFLGSESYETPEGKKGIRDDTEGKALRGYTETYQVAGLGGVEEIYETVLFRTFRFLRIEVMTGEEALTIRSVSYRETGYPLDVKASFECSDETLQPLWQISITTLQRCMHDNYFDCPYYEQLQYSMDTRLQILFTYAISGDDRLARKAIYDFHSSLMPNGMIQSRYPSVIQQVIPGFALYWIMIVHDHLLYYGDIAFASRFRPTIDAVLDWFERETGTDGLIGPSPKRYWSYVDWVKEWESRRGVPDTEGPLTVYNLMYVDALRKAADINRLSGRLDTANEYVARAARTEKAVRDTCWSEVKGLFRDGPNLELFSQHAQIWAILTGAAEPTIARQLANALMNDKSLAQVSYSMGYFLFRAQSAAGTYDEAYALWDMWKEQVDLHLTTWLEDPISQRSDCHAWGSVPLYDFTSEVLGLKPVATGYGRLRIEPKPGPLKWARGQAMAKDRLVRIDWKIEEGNFNLEVEGIGGIQAEIALPDGTVIDSDGVSDKLNFTCRVQ